MYVFFVFWGSSVESWEITRRKNDPTKTDARKWLFVLSFSYKFQRARKDSIFDRNSKVFPNDPVLYFPLSVSRFLVGLNERPHTFFALSNRWTRPTPSRLTRCISTFRFRMHTLSFNFILVSSRGQATKKAKKQKKMLLLGIGLDGPKLCTVMLNVMCVLEVLKLLDFPSLIHTYRTYLPLSQFTYFGI